MCSILGGQSKQNTISLVFILFQLSQIWSRLNWSTINLHKQFMGPSCSYGSWIYSYLTISAYHH